MQGKSISCCYRPTTSTVAEFAGVSKTFRIAGGAVNTLSVPPRDGDDPCVASARTEPGGDAAGSSQSWLCRTTARSASRRRRERVRDRAELDPLRRSIFFSASRAGKTSSSSAGCRVCRAARRVPGQTSCSSRSARAVGRARVGLYWHGMQKSAMAAPVADRRPGAAPRRTRGDARSRSERPAVRELVGDRRARRVDPCGDEALPPMLSSTRAGQSRGRRAWSRIRRRGGPAGVPGRSAARRLARGPGC